MKNRVFLTVVVILSALLLFTIGLNGQTKKYKPCGISLKSLSRTSGAPGTVFKMVGTWGPRQGSKIPCINKGGMNKLIVLHWSNRVLKVKVPRGLAPGKYKVGVYCNSLSMGGSYSSGWKDFKVTDKPVLKKVDIDITDIYLDKKCRLWLKHTNRGTRTLNVVLRERVWVNGRLVDDSRETINLAPGRWISHGVGADPGEIIRGGARVKAQIDVDNILHETNERNNIKVKKVYCKKFRKTPRKVRPVRRRRVR